MAEEIINNSFAIKVKSDFNKAAKKYDEYAVFQRKVCDQLFAQIRSDLNASCKVLDVGCGTGYMHELLRKNKIYSQLFQTDISHKMCEIADLYGSSGKFGETYSFVADAERSAIKDNVFDVILSSLCLQWTGLDKSLNEMKKTLKKGGFIAFSTILDGTFKELIDLSDLRVNKFLSLEKVNDIAEKVGFEGVEVYSKEIITYHDNIKQLLGSIKNIGAKYKGEGGAKFLGRNYFIDLEEAYFNKYTINGQIPLTWNIGFFVCYCR